MVDISELPSVHVASQLAGNVMHLAQAGAINIVVALFVERRDP